MRGAAVHCEKHRLIDAPRDAVWRQLTDPLNLSLFTVNLFHHSAQCAATELRRGTEVVIEHGFGPYRESRRARITVCNNHELAWTETVIEGEDWFPHRQRLSLTAASDSTCILHNHLDGAFRLAGARWWLAWWYPLVLGFILAAENRRISTLVQSSRI